CDVNSTEVSAQANDDSNAAAAPTHPPPTTGSLGHGDGSGPIALATALQAPAAGYEPNTLKKLACSRTAASACATGASSRCPSTSIRKMYTPSSPPEGRDSIFVRLMPRSENSCSTLTSVPGRSWATANASEVLSRPLRGGVSVPSRTKRVLFERAS